MTTATPITTYALFGYEEFTFDPYVIYMSEHVVESRCDMSGQMIYAVRGTSVKPREYYADIETAQKIADEYNAGATVAERRIAAKEAASDRAAQLNRVRAEQEEMERA